MKKRDKETSIFLKSSGTGELAVDKECDDNNGEGFVVSALVR